MPYCTLTEIEDFTGKLTTSQAQTATRFIAQAETYLNGEMRRAWLIGEQSLEAHYEPHDFVVLQYFPIDMVTAVYGRSGLGCPEELLVADEDYEVVDLAAGMVRIVEPWCWDRLRVTYTPTDEPPQDVRRACAELVAQWMQTALRPGTYGLDSYSLPDLSVKFARSHVQTAVPPFVKSVIENYRVPVVV